MLKPFSKIAFSALILGGLVLTIPLATFADPGSSGIKKAGTISFQREIRPIFSEHCFTCHGPDTKQRKADIRLDTEEGLKAAGIVAGKPYESDILLRMVHEDPKKVMPPPKVGKNPTKDEIAKVGEWIRQGAKIESHWAFTKVVRPALPEPDKVRPANWAKNPIDRFIALKLAANGMAPSDPASKQMLIRRLSLDLLGLPPTKSDIESFVRDESPDAYNRMVEKYLSSPHYGERLALDWLDSARFADTHGYHLDTARDMTKWREWVINAYNKDLPFDQFTIEQLAGDLLPNPTIDQKIASGFNRNHMITFEGGAIPEEYLNNYIIDRVNTTTTVWLGMSVACAQCHNHKYDPITQSDYYRLYAFFNRLPESGIGAVGNSAPLLETPTNDQSLELAKLDGQIAKREEELKNLAKSMDADFDKWLSGIARRNGPIWTLVSPEKAESNKGSKLKIGADKIIQVSGANPPSDSHLLTWKAGRSPSGILVELLPSAETTKLLGRSPNGNVVMTGAKLDMVGPDGKPISIPLKAVYASRSQNDYPATNLLKGNGKGWGIFPEVNKPHRLILDFEKARDVPNDTRFQLSLSYESPYGSHTASRFSMRTTDLPGASTFGAFPEGLDFTEPTWAVKPTEVQRNKLREWFVALSPGESGKVRVEMESLRKKRDELLKSFPTTMVMQDMTKPRETFVRIRGAYDKKGEKVEAGVPEILSPLPKGAPDNRLGLAKWLVSRENPLVARVYVNRIWQMLMGAGLVRTAEEFGSQGEQPTHPELLDWLAAEFMEPSQPSTPVPGIEGKAWSTRGLIRLIVTSEAYKQNSVVSQIGLSKDPENRLLSRASRVRLPAEIIRDQALAASGLLDTRIGGASVNPYQPPGLWEELMSREDSAKFTAQFFVQSKGPDLYRRSMYTFWKRTSPPAALATFDAPDRETCTVRRARTNTPLQALVLLNDPTYVEAARKLAERILLSGIGDAKGVANAFEAILARPPSDKETGVLIKVLEKQRLHFKAHPDAASRLLLVGESPADKSLSPIELAAWTMLSSVILNLDESVNRS